MLDANISWKLTAKIQPYVTSCLHVNHIGLAISAKDIDIWQYALDNDCIIITNDSDFLNLSNLQSFHRKW
ncbi:MAG: DUF5615 family PIN-like protein [Deinococcales bacterium]|nr:DUF5615 family PIN-like protein [Chitinophagaceae bacterium]